jgi:hypothetical protein
MPAVRRLAAILAADVAGYSRLMGADEEGTHERLKAHRREFLDPEISEHSGRVVKTTGDGMLVEFPSVVDAVRCAAEVQRAMIDREAGMNRIVIGSSRKGSSGPEAPGATSNGHCNITPSRCACSRNRAARTRHGSPGCGAARSPGFCRLRRRSASPTRRWIGGQCWDDEPGFPRRSRLPQSHDLVVRCGQG